MNKYTKKGREGGRNGNWDDRNEDRGKSELNLCSILKMITLDFMAVYFFLHYPFSFDFYPQDVYQYQERDGMT